MRPEDMDPTLWQGDMVEVRRLCWETFQRLVWTVSDFKGLLNPREARPQRRSSWVNIPSTSSSTLHRLDMSVEALRKQIVEAEKHLDDLRSQLQEAEQLTNVTHDTIPPQSNPAVPAASDTSTSLLPNPDRPLDLDEYKRYGRQMIVPSIGLEGQATCWLRD